MAKKFVSATEPDGKFLSGVVLDYPDEYTHDTTEEAFNNSNRAQYVNGAWIVHPVLTLTLDVNTITAGGSVTAKVTLPAGSPAPDVTFIVSHGIEQAAPIVVTAVNGQAVQTFQFAEVGQYQIAASTRFNGASNAGVTVN